MTLTSRQIREARALLELQRNELDAMVKTITTATIVRAESVDGELPITAAQAAVIQEALERADVEFTSDPPSARLREAEP